MTRIRLSDRYDLIDRHPERGAPTHDDVRAIFNWVVAQWTPIDWRAVWQKVGPSEVKGG